MSTPAAPAVVLTPDKEGPYAHGDPVAVTVQVVQPVPVKVSVQVTLPDGQVVTGDLDIPGPAAPVSGFTVTSATDSLGDSFTVEPGPDGAVVLRTALGTPAA